MSIFIAGVVTLVVVALPFLFIRNEGRALFTVLVAAFIVLLFCFLTGSSSSDSLGSLAFFIGLGCLVGLVTGTLVFGSKFERLFLPPTVFGILGIFILAV